MRSLSVLHEETIIYEKFKFYSIEVLIDETLAKSFLNVWIRFLADFIRVGSGTITPVEQDYAISNSNGLLINLGIKPRYVVW